MVIGIDLGTTNSAVAYVDEAGRPQIISNQEGERITPSVLLFEGKNPLVGSIAKIDSVSDPLNTVQFVKRHMGNPDFSFIREDGENFSPEELSAIIIKKLKLAAEDFLGQEVNQAVITVPAYFNDSQRKSTQDAGNIAGLEVLKVINEPTSAALAYGLTGKIDNHNLAVYDLGGGTFDVVIMNISANEIKILATGGDKNLGGFDFDNEIIQFVVEEFEKNYGLDLYDDEYAMQELREKAEEAKKILAVRDKARINLSCQGQRGQVELSLDDFNAMIKPYIDRTKLIMDVTLEDSGLKWQDIHRTLLVGGSTRLRMVQDAIEEITGQKPSLDLDPDEIVAMGAALQAQLLKGEITGQNVLKDTRIIDVNSHSLGTIANNLENQPENTIILEKNTPIPASAEDTFYLSSDNQNHIRVKITEGEDKDVDFVQIIGEGIIQIPPGYKKSSPLKFILSYDINAMVHLEVIDLSNGQSLGAMEIKRTSNLSSIEVEKKSSKISDLEIQ